jgi:transposase
MRAYSVDLRQRIVDALEEAGATIDSVSQRFCVSSASVKRYKRQLQESGNLAAKPWPGRSPKIAPEEQERLKEMVASRSDWTLQRLCLAWNEQTGAPLSISVMARTLARLKITYKKRAKSPGKETRRNDRHSSKR